MVTKTEINKLKSSISASEKRFKKRQEELRLIKFQVLMGFKGLRESKKKLKKLQKQFKKQKK